MKWNKNCRFTLKNIVCAGICFCHFSIPSLALVEEASSAIRHANQGFIFARTGEWSGAETEFRRATELAPRNPGYLFALGEVLGNL